MKSKFKHLPYSSCTRKQKIKINVRAHWAVLLVGLVRFRLWHAPDFITTYSHHTDNQPSVLYESSFQNDNDNKVYGYCLSVCLPVCIVPKPYVPLLNDTALSMTLIFVCVCVCETEGSLTTDTDTQIHTRASARVRHICWRAIKMGSASTIQEY